MTFLHVFLRTYLVGAAFNMRGLQNVGFMYAIDPALTAIHKSPKALHAARLRYVRHYNCHPYWTPLVAGMFLHIEAEIANSRMSPEAFLKIKDATVNTLSALGDSVFGGTLLAMWALAMASMVITGYGAFALAASIALFLSLQVFKLGIFVAGVRLGFPAILHIRRWNLIDWGDRLKIANAFLLLLFLVLCMPPAVHPVLWMLTVLCIMVAAYLASRLHISRALIALAAMIALLLV